MGKSLPSMTTQSQAAQEVRRLMEKKENIEAEMEGHRGRLEAENSTMNSSLVTLDGFPRDDIDVLAVRQARVRLIELRNDLKHVMSQIEAALHQALPASASSSSSSAHPPSASSASHTLSNRRPFALIKSVDPAGPASSAGLFAQDSILLFGDVDAENHQNLKAVAVLVGRSEGSPISVEVSRGETGQIVALELVPESGWGGRGTLGMHIVPI